jgi:tetratricopeptide (TPR) repeat protein
MGEWRTGRFRFDQSVEDMPEDVVGPLPTAYLVMEGAVRHRQPQELMQQLGGEGRLLVASLKSDLLSRLHGIDPEQMFLLSRAEEPISVAELLRQVSIDREATLRKLCRLHAIGLLQHLEPKASTHDRSQRRLVDSLVGRFSARIEKRLHDEPLKIDASEHRARIAELVRDVGSLSYYELLGIGLHATEDEIYGAYDNLAQLVHPSHADRLGLRGRDAGLRTLFERATVAYLTLADPERRASYNINAGIEAVRTPSPDRRSEEQQRLAREAFEKGAKRFDAEDYHTAMELVKQALRLGSRPEYFALQGQIEARNPHWLYRAAESYRQALRLDPANADYRVALGEVLEQRGDTDGARVHYRVALKEQPTHTRAAEGLERVGPGAREPVPAPAGGGSRSRLSEQGQSHHRKGLLERIKRLFGG